MNKIKTPHIQAFINNLCENGMSRKFYDIDEKSGEKIYRKLSGKTVYNYIASISSVFHYAISQGIVSFNPCSGAVLPKKEHKEVEAYTLEEAQQLMTKLQDEPFNRRLAIILAMYCGFRRGEIYGLEWKDIDFANHTITINRTSLYSKEKGVYTDSPKTEKSKCCNKVSSGIIGLLAQYKKWQLEQRMLVGPEWNETDRLFTTWNGMDETPNNIENWWLRFCQRSNIRHLKFHSLRHFNATMLIANHADTKTVSASLGHANISTTLDIYATASPKNRQSRRRHLMTKSVSALSEHNKKRPLFSGLFLLLLLSLRCCPI